jgi:glycosyltransferase involved in cell wall biosynthesis
MKIAVVGFRGIPAKYGGYETFIEEMAPLLVKRGHEVTVYGRSHIIVHKEKYYKGVKLVILPTIQHKYFDTVVHTLLSLTHGVFCRYDVVLILNAANSPIAFIPKLTGEKVVMNVDGIERLRKKWNWIGKLYYRVGEYFATKFPDEIVSDAGVIEKYYLQNYGKRSTMIPYGANIECAETEEILHGYQLKKKSYFLYVSRLEPENNADKVIKAFKLVKTDKSLVIVGDAPYSEQYKDKLRDLAADDKRITFTGFVFGKGYREFISHAYCYIQATEVGGTHPALIESMGVGNCLIANGTDENIEVLADTGFLYEKNNIDDLSSKMQYVSDHPEIIGEYGSKAQRRVCQNYTWEAVTTKYEELFKKMLMK